jgi:hypothetical protein
MAIPKCLEFRRSIQPAPNVKGGSKLGQVMFDYAKVTEAVEKKIEESLVKPGNTPLQQVRLDLTNGARMRPSGNGDGPRRRTRSTSRIPAPVISSST